MKTTENPPALFNSSNSAGLEKFLSCNTVSLDLVSALAGDRPLSDMESIQVEALKADRGDQFYGDLLYTITHRSFPPPAAENLWNKILQHKYLMSTMMKRNIRIAVASLDYLSNLTTTLPAATVIDEEQIAEIVRLSLHDGLTGLFNHSYFFQRLDMELARFTRYGTALSILILDVDNFKEINDLHGHQEGDKILTWISSVIRLTSRDSDICCRYGGEEFSVILPSTDVIEAATFAERLRAKLAESQPDGLRITVSVGVACCSKQISGSESFVKSADMALYQAKRNGKNQVVVSGDGFGQ